MKSTDSSKPKLSPTEAKVVKAKIEGELTGRSQATMAKKVFPNQTPGSASVYMTTNLKKPNVQEALQVALEEHGLTADSVVGVVADGMKAEKTVVTGKDNDAFADQVPDHSIRLKAAGMASQFMGIGKTNVEGGVHFHNHTGEKKADYEF